VATEKPPYGMNLFQMAAQIPETADERAKERLDRQKMLVSLPKGDLRESYPDLLGWPQRGCSGEFGGHASSGEHSPGWDSSGLGGEEVNVYMVKGSSAGQNAS